MPDNIEYLLGTIVSKLDILEQSTNKLRDEFTDYRNDSVSRGEWVQRNNYVDGRFTETNRAIDNKGKEIAEIKSDLNSRRTPWSAVAAISIAAIALLWTIFTPVFAM